MRERLASLDAFRGFTIAGMLLVNNPGDWSNLYPQLAHAAWHGWTFTDWIFPFFLFIVGASMALSGQGKSLLSFYKRAAIIILIGLTLNFVPNFDFSTLRWPGVLQRIGLCIMLAAPLVLYCSSKTIVVSSIGLLVVYTFVQTQIPVADANGVLGTGILEAGRDVGSAIDRALMQGHLWTKAKVWDPEGLLSTLPAVVSLLLGALTGRWIAQTQVSNADKTVWMLLAGLACLWAGAMLNAVTMPINKNLWTPSYTVFVTGWALLVFGAFFWLLDACSTDSVRAVSARLFKPLVYFGMNALFLFALSSLVAKALNYFNIKSSLFAPISQLPFSANFNSLIFASAFVGCFLLIAKIMFQKKWFIKV